MRAIDPVARHLAARAPDGVVRVGRRAFEGAGTWARDPDGTWRRHASEPTFELLETVARPDVASAPLTAEWRHTRRALIALIDAGRVT